MNLTDGIALRGRPAVIPDSNREMLPAFCVEQGYRVGAEIGVYKGAFTESFLRVGLRMHAIDPWQAYRGGGRTQQQQARQDFLCEHAQRTLEPYADRCTILRATSLDALTRFRDGELDFVYIDGDHSFPFAAQDVYWWSRKVRSGGLVAGHDYFNTAPHANNVLCHVKAVVDAYTECFGIDRWWTFGRSKPIEQEARPDKTLSWMWIKP